MISIQDKKECCGCSACASICPKHCITMTEDSEGFLYPEVDIETCIQCGLCEKVCNEKHPFEKREPLQVIAAINKDDGVRLRSSSGGVFYLLAERIIREGGVVFGARFDENWQVVIDYAEDMKAVEAFMGSKYVQARAENSYKDAKRFLEEGRKVLYSGTPCLVAGLHQFLRKKYDNLLTIDIVCHGTPSPKVWGMYLDEVIKEGQRISSRGRNKKKMWKKFGFRLRYNEADNTISMLSSAQQNLYMKAFLHDIILRPSCHDCKVKKCNSLSDITLADFWGVGSVFPDMDDDKGTELVFLLSPKGKEVLDVTKVKVAETTYECIKPLNSACYRSPKVHPKREEFFACLGKKNLLDLINDFTKPTFRQKVRLVAYGCKSLIKRMLYKLFGWNHQIDIHDEPLNVGTLKIPEYAKIVSVCFRCKDRGWKRYSMDIRMK